MIFRDEISDEEARGAMSNTITLYDPNEPCEHGYELGYRHWVDSDGEDLGPDPMMGDRLSPSVRCPGGRERTFRQSACDSCCPQNPYVVFVEVDDE